MNELLKPGFIFPKIGNQQWPLPADYGPDMTAEGRRLARINACRMFVGPEEAVASWAWFKHWYLEPDENTGYDPAFYDPPFKASPPLHYSLVRNWWNYEYMALCWPRGYAKTTTKKAMLLWLACSAGNYKVLSVLATDDFCTSEMSSLKTHLMENPRIRDDFGNLRGPRGTGIWNNHDFELSNGFKMMARSIKSAKRGIRANWIVLDDAERDETTEGGVQEARRQKRKELTQVIVPMMKPGSKISYIGTLIQQSLLHHIIEEDSGDEDSTKGRFRSIDNGGQWYKQHVGAIDAAGRSLWSQMYNLDYLMKRREVMGEANFQTEMLNIPSSEEAPLFVIESPKHEYWIEDGIDPSVQDSPFEGTTKVCYYDGDTVVRRPYGEWLAGMYRAITVDYAYAMKQDSDFCAVVVTGIDNQGRIWVLDCWQGKVPSARLADTVFVMARKWRCATIGVEAVAAQMEVYERVKDYFESRTMSDDWGPSVYPIKYPAGVSKESRISGLEPRFVRGLIKLPKHRRMSGAFMELYRQIAGFTGEPRALRHDDLLDALSMVRSMAGSRGGTLGSGKSTPVTPEELLAEGHTTIPGTGVSLAGLVGTSSLTGGRGDVIMDIARRRRDAQLTSEGAWDEGHDPREESDVWLNDLPPADQSSPQRPVSLSLMDWSL